MQHQLSGNTASHQTATFTKHIFCRISNTKVEIFMTSFNLSLSENGASKCLHAEFACYHTTKTFLCVFTANL